MTYEESIHYLYHRLPMFSRSGAKAYKANLKNTLALCDFLDNPEKKIRSIHIAGTNGKGSVSHMLAAIFQENGYKTGLYTSPHLKDFRERIKINGVMIPESFVTGFIERTQSFSDEIKPSFFELTFVMAIDYFARQQTDIAIIETGLGGRLDSTNIVSPLVSVITNISFDHMDILGNTLEAIAIEKAGIIKRGIPALIGQSTPETQAVFQKKALETGSPLYFAEEKYGILSSTYSTSALQVRVLQKETGVEDTYLLDLNGLYQQKNILPVLGVTDLLNNQFQLNSAAIHHALRNVKTLTGLYGRWEVIREKPLVVLDVAHNEDGIRQLLDQISRTPFYQLHIVFGMVKDKDIQKVLCQLPTEAKYYFTKAQNPRALPEEELRLKAASFHLEGVSYPEVNLALKAALNEATPNDLIMVCGSVFIVAEVDL